MRKVDELSDFSNVTDWNSKPDISHWQALLFLPHQLRESGNICEISSCLLALGNDLESTVEAEKIYNKVYLWEQQNYYASL